MAARVLLVSTNTCTTPDPVFPLGLAMVNAALRAAGYETRWLDCMIEPDAVANAVAEFQPDVVGLSLRNIDDIIIRTRETYYGALTDLCGAVRGAHRCPIVLGGSGYSIFPAKLLERSGADYGIHGDGEASFLRLIEALQGGGEISSIPGLVFRRDGRVVCNLPELSPTVAHVESADRPARLVEYYLSSSAMLNVQTQRGCAHTCCYCTYPLLEGRRHRARPPELVAEEMAQLQAAGARYAFIVDSVFNSSAEHVEAVCEALLRRDLKLRWGCFLRPQGLTPSLVRLMARAGLSHIEFGSDSFCDSILDEYGKKLSYADIEQATEAARAAEVEHCHFLILGGPGETDETLRVTYERSVALGNPIIMAVMGMRIYPGTTLHARALREGQVTRETDLLAPTYYLAPGLTSERVFSMVQAFARQSSNWVVGDPGPGYQRVVSGLRKRGVAGPLWSYFALARKLWPDTGAKTLS